MPPRIHLPFQFRSISVPSTSSGPAVPAGLERCFSTSLNLNAPGQQKRKHRDPYALAQARQRKAANLARQEVLKKERAASLGDPVRGLTTRFVQSFDHTVPGPIQPTFQSTSRNKQEPSVKESMRGADDKTHLNHFVSPDQLDKALKYSHLLTQPVISTDASVSDPVRDEEKAREHKHWHANAETAISRIVSLANGSSKDRLRVNIQRCVDMFGRHNTDRILAPKPAVNFRTGLSLPPLQEKTPRAGPDTGSSEVQIAILTAKIRALANHLTTIGRPDKVNKRNLRLLVHKRQKLLKYLRRKERGGERWQNIVHELGLTDGTWKGEISL
ncbi:putative ribosomal protein S15 [Xylona heveae TC161]|uniref:Putative ribosomal protein S15 n=1 Tax=Xylona heveae (strain CBS 132557 / TC161) TaxID=1328760 RepID=A0A165IRA7_XYLHT|nr:putative ribosomal protein S15 [Xylona heveae TC161]KZF25271.1 putative ribosomal protein S15 [Xylona heveae TC161]